MFDYWVNENGVPALCCHRDAILARRKALHIRHLAARRKNYRKLVRITRCRSRDTGSATEFAR